MALTSRSGNMTAFYHEGYNFGISYPADWTVVYQDEPAGSWTIPIAVAGPAAAGARPSFMVNARRGEILQGSAQSPVYAMGADGQLIKMPSTPQEYIELNGASLAGAFAGYRLISTETITLADKPAARMIYSYDGEGGRITEEMVTLFGVGVTFQFICEMPAARVDELRPVLRGILESFRLGRPAPKEEAPAEPSTAEPQSPEELYNRAVSLYEYGQFAEALSAFEACFNAGAYQRQAAYAMILCQEQLGRGLQLPEGPDDLEEEATPVYLATNLACHLLGRGHRAALVKQGKTSEVQGEVEGARYRISIVSGFGLGGYFSNAWRKDGDRYIPLGDASANPYQTEADKLVLSLLKDLANVPPAKLPLGGLPTSLDEPPPVPASSEAAEGKGLAQAAAEAEPMQAVAEPAEEVQAPTLPDGLASEDAAVQQKAVEATVGLGAAVAPQLVEALAQGDSTLRGSAAAVLTELAKKVEDPATRASAVIALLGALGDPKPATRKEVATALGEFADGRAFDALVASLDDSDKDVRGAAAMALGALGDTRAIALLADRLARSQGEERFSVAVGLGKLHDPRGLQLLLDQMRDPNWLQRSIAAFGLALTEDERAVAPLVAGLHDRERLVRMACADALAAFDSAEVWQALSALQNDKDAELRTIVVRSLGKIRERNPRLAAVSPAQQATPAGAQPAVAAEAPIVAAGVPSAATFLIPHGDVSLSGGQLTMKLKRLSSETATMALGDLRLAYFFMPTQFTWRPMRTSKYNYQWVNLDTLPEADYSLLTSAIGQQHQLLLRDSAFVLMDSDYRIAWVQWKQLGGRGLELLAQLWEGREARRERTARWLDTNPTIVIEAQRGLFRSSASLNATGIASKGDRYIPWNELDKFRVTQVEGNLGKSCNLEFSAPKASGRKAITLAFDPKWTEPCLALVDFWRSRTAGAAAAPPPAPAPTKMATLAGLSLAAGILTWLFLPFLGAIVAIATGHLAKSQIRKSGGKLRGQGQATTGLVLGYAQMVLLPIVVVLLVLAKPKAQAPKTPSAATPSIVAAVAQNTATPSWTPVVATLTPTMAQPAAVVTTHVIMVATATPSATNAIHPTPEATATSPEPTAAPVLYATATPAISAPATPTIDPEQALAIGQALRATVEANPTWAVGTAFDSFDANIHSWPIGTQTNSYCTWTQAFVDGTYRWDIEAFQGVHSSIRFPAAPVSTFYFVADVRQVSGPDSTHGVLLRVDGDNQYFFGIVNAQYFCFSRLYDGEWTQLIDWTPAPIIRPWETNRLTVVASGAQFVFLINDQVVGVAEDDMIPEGQVGFATDMMQGNTAAFEFDNLELRVPPQPSSGTPVAPAAETPTITVGSLLRVVSAAGLVMREAPRTDAPSVRMLEQGAILEVISGPQEVAGLAWWQVRAADTAQEGWVVASFDGSAFLEVLPMP